MELRHLRYFDAVATDLHVTQAAERLGVAQPALTQQIRSLEAELGLKLWQKSGRGIELTEAGRVFHEEARAILQRSQTAVLLVQKVARGESGRVVIGYIESASFNDTMTSLIADCRHQWPDVELELVQDRTTNLVRSMQQRRVDIAFVRPPLPEATDISFFPLTHEHLVVAVSKHHRFAERSSLTISELAGEEFVMLGRRVGSSGLNDLIHGACADNGFVRKTAQVTPNFASSINLVAASLGIAVVPECMRHLRADTVSYIPLEILKPLVSEMGIAYRSSEQAPAVLIFIKQAKDMVIIK